MSRKKTSILAVIIAALFWTVSLVVNKYQLSPIKPISLMSITFLLAGFFLLIVRLALKNHEKILRQDYKLFLSTALLVFLHFVLFYLAGRQLDTTESITFFSFQSFITLLCASLLLGTNITPYMSSCVGISAIGAVLMMKIFPLNNHIFIAYIVMLISIICWSLSCILMSNLLQKYRISTLVSYQCLLAGIVSIPALIIENNNFGALQAKDFLTIGYLGFIGVAVCLLFVAFGLKQIGAVPTSLFLAVGPVFLLMASFIGGGVTWQSARLLGAGMLVIGVILAAIKIVKIKKKWRLSVMQKRPSLKLSLIGTIGVLVILLVGIIVFKMDVIVLLTIGIAYVTIVAHFNQMTLENMIDGMKEGCSQALVGLLFFPLVGAIIGIWIQSGTIPALVYYGLDILNPKFFLISSFFICSVVSLVIGTSWGTIGTVGLAIMGVAIGSNLTIPIGAVAGSIVSGAWFGDKMSPISDSTVLTSTAVGTDLYKHIRSMCYTTLPSFGVSLIIFGIMNYFFAGNASLDYGTITPIQNELSSQFQINFWVFLPPIVLIICCILKLHAFVTLLSSIATGVLCSVIVQHNTLASALSAVISGVSVESAVPEVATLLNRGGLNSMMSSLFLCLMAICLGGVLQKSLFLHVIIEKVSKYMKSTFSLVLSTMITCVLGNAIFADNYLTIVLNANLYRDLYDEHDLDLSMLSRTIEETATLSAPLIPWTAASAFIFGALGLTVADYGMYAVLNLVNPILALTFAAIGFGVIKKKKDGVNEKGIQV